MIKFIISLLSSLIFFSLLWVTPALADDPPCEGPYTVTYYFDGSNEGWQGEACYSSAESQDAGTGSLNGTINGYCDGDASGDIYLYKTRSQICQDIGLASNCYIDTNGFNYTVTVYPLGTYPTWTEIDLWIHPTEGTPYLADQWVKSGWSQWPSQTPSIDGLLDKISINHYGTNWYLDVIQITVPCVRGEIEEEEQECSIVSNPDFTTADDWLLAGSAAISGGVLSFSEIGDIAAQNLDTLESNTDYTAAISVTQVTTPTTLSVVLGTDSEPISVSDTGEYEVSFTTPVLGGSLAYGLENVGNGEIDIDFTCLYDDSGARQCIAPTNGEFEGGDGWDYYRGAVYNDLGQNAYLPFNPGGDDEKALLIPSATYSMPALAAGEYLLLAFESKTAGDSGILGVQVSGTDTFTGFYEIYPNFYKFEANLSTLESEEISMAFVNSGVDPITSLAAEDNLYLDNVCIWVSDRPAELPEPIDDNPIIPPTADFGWTYTCADIPGILYGFGINVLTLEAIYEQGVSVWDPSGWVPWLASALWVNAGKTISCFILSLFGWLISLIQYLLNEWLNWLHWARLSLLAFVVWLGSYLSFLNDTIDNFIVFIQETAYNWLNWFAVSLANLAESPGYLFNNLAILAQWVEWLGNTLGGNELRTIANWFIDGWNFWLESWGVVISEIISLFVSLWNMAAPLLESVWSYVSSVGLIGLIIDVLVDFIDAGWDLFWMVLTWLWENVFMAVNIPIQFYYAFDAGINSDAFDYLLTCEDQNFWCNLLAGMYLVNESSSHSVVYPVVIVGIIVGTIIIFWRNIWSLFKVDIQ